MSIPYGLRDVKITPYIDPAGKQLGSTRVDLPVAQTFSFSEVEEFATLRGDDRPAAEHGSGSSGEWSLGHGGISLEALVAMNGGEIITGVGTRRYRKTSDHSKPYFLVEGQIMNDDGGDTHLIVYRCKASGNIEGEFADGSFFVTSASGSATPVPEDALENANFLYDIVENDEASAISVSVVPRVTGATPQEAGADDLVMLQGGGFDGVTEVTVGGVDALAITVFSDAALTFEMPAGAAGAAPIVVTHPVRGASTPFAYSRTV